VNARDRDGVTPLHDAALGGQAPCIVQMAEKGVCVCAVCWWTCVYMMYVIHCDVMWYVVVCVQSVGGRVYI